MSSPTVSALPPLLLLVLLVLPVLPGVASARGVSPRFVDATPRSGFPSARQLKFGGPLVVDLNADSYPDLVFCYHGSENPDILYNNRRASPFYFRAVSLRKRNDFHGFTAFRRVPFRNVTVVFSRGGARGARPSAAFVFDFKHAARREMRLGFEARSGRGRGSLPLDLKKNGGRFLDLIMINAPPKPPFTPPQHHAFENTAGTFRPRFAGPFVYHQNKNAIAIDMDNDGVMEVVSFHNLSLHALKSPFNLVDITSSVLPAALVRPATHAVFEFDYDNDGWFDLFVVQSPTGDFPRFADARVPPRNYLLRNIRGRFYQDVTTRANVPKDGRSTGVTGGDFNNDGFVDVYISNYDTPDYLLLNNADGTFRRVNALTDRPRAARGDMAQAVDFDNDGRLDLVVSQGDHFNLRNGGVFRLFRNTIPYAPSSRWLLVWVGNAPERKCTGLYALVVVKLNRMKIRRRVGTAGVRTGSSLIEVVHFGVGTDRIVNVVVKYTCGVVLEKTNVNTNKMIRMGMFW